MHFKNLIKLTFLPFFFTIGFAYQSTNPYVKYISKDNHKMIELKYAFLDYYDCNEKKPDMVVETLEKWMLKKKHYSRKNLHFKTDYNLPLKCRAYPKDMGKKFGVDHGHNAPNYDWAWNRKYQKQTFLMSNITAQVSSFNRYLWKYIEGFARYLSSKYEKIFIYTGSFGFKNYAKNKVVIPKYFYKLILVPKTKEAYLFLCENKKYKRKRYSYSEIQKYLVSLEDFNRLNKDFNLELEGNWNFKTEIKKESLLRKSVKTFFKLLSSFH